MSQKLIPFCVADRPISLSIIKGVSLATDIKIGILSQAATTTSAFKKLFASYPYGTDVIYSNGEPSDKSIERQTVKIADSGIFGKKGCHLSYKELFAAYETMKADYGIMIDAFGDCNATLASARKGIKEYKRGEQQFELVGVAQGKTIQEYLLCYEKLVAMGYTKIALGGLLRKRKNTVRFAHVHGGMTVLEKLLKAVRQNFDPAWLFVLGAFHPKRIELFHEYGVWGSDCKGWIFNYLKRDEVIELIRAKKLKDNCRVAFPDLKIKDVKGMSEQELRFKLTRGHIERSILEAVNGCNTNGRNRH